MLSFSSISNESSKSSNEALHYCTDIKIVLKSKLLPIYGIIWDKENHFAQGLYTDAKYILWTLFWHFEMCFFTEELSLFTRSFTRSWIKLVVLPIKYWLHRNQDHCTRKRPCKSTTVRNVLYMKLQSCPQLPRGMQYIRGSFVPIMFF